MKPAARKHVQVCDGGVLPEGDPDRVYAVRTNGLLAYELLDVTDPANPAVISTIAETGDSSRPESSRGNRETHKIQWECETGVGYFNGTPEGWRVTRVLQAFDLSNPEAPRHIRDFGLAGWEPTAEGPMPEYSISGLHQPFVHGDYMYLGYGSGNNGTLQILDKNRFPQRRSACGRPVCTYPGETCCIRRSRGSTCHRTGACTRPNRHLACRSRIPAQRVASRFAII